MFFKFATAPQSLEEYYQSNLHIFAPQHFKSRLRNIFTPFLGFDFAKETKWRRRWLGNYEERLVSCWERRTGGLARKLKFCPKLNKHSPKLETQQIINKTWPAGNIFDVTDIYLDSCSNYRVFLSNPGKPGVRSMGTDVSADLTDVTLADEDTNSILTDNANRAIQGNVAMQWEKVF